MPSPATPLILIFTGYNQRAVLAFLRTITSYDLPYVLLVKDEEDPLLKTAYANEATIVRSSPELTLTLVAEYLSTLKKLTGHDRFFIAPSTEFLNRFLLLNREELEAMNCTIPLVSRPLYEQISDKKSFTELCTKSGLGVPEEHSKVDSGMLPVVAKPLKYKSENGKIYTPFILSTREEVDLFKQEYQQDDFYFQRFVEGRSIYLLYYRYGNGKIVALSQENYVQRPGGKSMVAAVTSDYHQQPSVGGYAALLAKVSFRGLVMVEVKVEGEKVYTIEANPRFWGPSQLFVDANVNLFLHLLVDYQLLPAAVLHDLGPPKTPARYAWMAGYFRDTGHTYYEITPLTFDNQLVNWLAADVYCRPDSISIFKRELYEGIK